MPVGESSSAAYDSKPGTEVIFWHLSDKRVGLIAVTDKKKPVIVIF
jgi:hypothetical protein